MAIAIRLLKGQGLSVTSPRLADIPFRAPTRDVPLLQPALTAFDDPLTALFDALGITFGGADITVLSLDAEQPALAR